MTFEEQPETEVGRALFEELRSVHSAVRRDLAAVRGLAARLAPQRLLSELAALETRGPLWELRVSCLRCCRLVHLHHDIEDVALFPAVRRANPAISSVIERLQFEHRKVSALLDEVAAAANGLTQRDTDSTRKRLADALSALDEHLLAHLECEEASIGPTIRRMHGLK